MNNEGITFMEELLKIDGVTLEGAAMITAQCHYESGGFVYLVENLNYNSAGLLRVFSKYFNSSNIQYYIHKPERIASRVYANRMGNGPELSGDGWKYRGRGYIQLTGKDNYRLYGSILELDLVHNPDLLLTPDIAFKCAYQFFVTNNILNNISCVKVTRVINGGLTGYDSRQKLYMDYLLEFKT